KPPPPSRAIPAETLSPAEELIAASRGADDAALAFLVALERRRAAIRAAVRASKVSSPLGARAQQAAAVDQAFAAHGLSDHATVARPAARNRRTFLEQARRLLDNPPRVAC